MFLLLPVLGVAQNRGKIVKFDDEILKSLLVLNQSVNTNGDDEIQISEAQNVKRLSNLNHQNIQSIKGLENFTHLEELNLEGNQIKTLKPIDNLEKIKILNVRQNPITSVDLKKIKTNLDVDLSLTEIKKLDVSGMENLYRLLIEETPLEEINLKGCSGLQSLQISKNRLKQIDLEGLQSLSNINFSENQVSEINVKNFPKLNYLQAENNLLKEIDLTGTENLSNLFLAGNPISEIDLSKQRKLVFLGLEKMDGLKKLDISANKGFIPQYALKVLFLEKNQNLEYLNLLNGVEDLTLSYRDEKDNTQVALPTLPALKIVCVNTEKQKEELIKTYAGASKTPQFFVGKSNCPSYVPSVEVSKEILKSYPHLVKDVLYFSKKIENVKIYDSTGRLIFSQKNIKEVNMSPFSKGVYWVNILDNGETKNEKVIKE